MSEHGDIDFLDEETAPNDPLRPGDVFHVLHPSLVSDSPRMGSGRNVRRGDVLQLTQGMIDASRNVRGEAWTDLIHDPAAQLAKWGRVRFAPGPWPEELETWIPGSREWEAAREIARSEAHAIIDPAKRQEALRAVHERFGDGGVKRPAREARNLTEERALAEDAHRRSQQPRARIWSD